MTWQSFGNCSHLEFLTWGFYNCAIADRNSRVIWPTQFCLLPNRGDIPAKAGTRFSTPEEWKAKLTWVCLWCKILVPGYYTVIKSEAAGTRTQRPLTQVLKQTTACLHCCWNCEEIVSLRCYPLYKSHCMLNGCWFRQNFTYYGNNTWLVRCNMLG